MSSNLGNRTIYLLRHAQVETAYEDCCRGITDCELSDIGRRTSQRNAEFLLNSQVQLVVTSGLRRTDYVGELLQESGIEHVAEPSFRERNFGQWEGRKWQDIATEYPVEYSQWERFERVAIPGGETLDQLQARAIAAWELLLRRSFSRAAVVSHGAFNLSLLWHLMGGWADGGRPRQQHGCLNEIQIVDGVPRVAQLNILIGP